MSKVYLSFLGTTDYTPCSYFLGKQEVKNVKFVQEATVQFCCQNWTSNDRIVIFTTEEAFRKNWNDSNQLGLKHRIEQLKLNPSLKRIPIPEGKSREEIWEIFGLIFDQLSLNDEIVFDITHGFRSIPMLAIIVLNYAKIMKNISIEKILYGALEALGSPQEIKNIPSEQRRIPIVDLTEFDFLLDWSTAIDRFIRGGDASAVETLALKTKLISQNKSTNIVSVLGRQLDTFTKIISTCRGTKITEVTKSLKEKINQCENFLKSLPPFFKPLVAKLKKEMSEFTEDNICNGIQTVKWCCEHNLIQQGYTILMETLISFLVRKIFNDLTDKKYREIASQAVTIFHNKIQENEWQPPSSEHPEITKSYLECLKKYPELVEIYLVIKNYRNDINHAGYRDSPMDAKKFAPKLKELISKLENYL